MARVEVQAELLRWALVRSNHTENEACERWVRFPEWLAGTRGPTVRQLENFAKWTRTPFGYLFLESPPEDRLPIPDFRTVQGEARRPSPDLLETVQAMQRRQDWLRGFLTEENEEPLPFIDAYRIDSSPELVANSMRDALGLDQIWARHENSWEASVRLLRNRIEEAGKLSKVIMGTPSKTARKELWKVTIMTLLGGKVSPDVVARITEEIDAAGFTTADPEVIIAAKDAGLVGEQLASIALGFPKDEYLQARKDHAARIELIAKQQGVDKAPMGPASRGVVDLDDNPANSGSEEKTESRETDEQDTTEDRTRGAGQNNKE